MSPKKDSPTKRTKKQKRLSDAEVFALADHYERAAAAEGEAKKTKAEVAAAIIGEVFRKRKLNSVESKQFGRFTRITVVEGTHVEYDEAGLWVALGKLRKRRKAFDTFINLNLLSDDRRKDIYDALTKDERKAITTHVLNTERLAAAVTADEIPAEIVADHSEVVKNAPYIRISHGTGE